MIIIILLLPVKLLHGHVIRCNASEISVELDLGTSALHLPIPNRPIRHASRMRSPIRAPGRLDATVVIACTCRSSSWSLRHNPRWRRDGDWIGSRQDIWSTQIAAETEKPCDCDSCVSCDDSKRSRCRASNDRTVDVARSFDIAGRSINGSNKSNTWKTLVGVIETFEYRRDATFYAVVWIVLAIAARCRQSTRVPF